MISKRYLSANVIFQ